MRRHNRSRRRSDFRAKRRVITPPACRVQKTNLRLGDLVEQSLRMIGVRSDSIRLDMCGLSFGRGSDHLSIGLKQFKPEKSIVIGRLVLGPNAQPAIVWVKVRFVRHSGPRRNDGSPLLRRMTRFDPHD